MKRVIVVCVCLALIFMISPGRAQPTAAPPELLALAETVMVQLELALEEASFAWIATTHEDVKVSSQRVLNILVGKDSEDYSPIEGDAEDDIGALDNLVSLKTMLEETPWADFAFTADSAMTFANWASGRAKEVLAMPDEETARTEIHKAEAFLRAALGCAEGLPTTGGANTILKALQDNGPSALIRSKVVADFMSQLFSQGGPPAACPDCLSALPLI